MEKKENFDSDFNKKDITTSAWFWNYMEDYWHNNREFPESVENHLNRKADLIDGKVPSSQLPNYVDDVLEFNAFENLPVSGEKGKIYLVTNNNTQFRWSGSEYIQINSDENLMTIDTVQDITGHKQFNSGMSLGSNQRMYIKTASDVAHYVANFADDLDGFAVSTGFAVKPYNDTASNWLLVNGAGAYSNGQLLSTQTWANSAFHKKDQTGGINNGSDGRTNTSWFDYNWAGKNTAGSVINFSGFEGYSTELFSSYNIPNSIGIRSRQGDIGVWNEPRWIWHDKNFNPANFVLPSSDNWIGKSTITDRKVVGELAWKNYGNGHTIFDISSGATPWGDTISNTDAQQPWSPSFPTLVGGNGLGTYGVRVDSARVSDNTERLGGILASNYTQAWENVKAIGFNNGNSSDNPYIYHNTDGYIFLATQAQRFKNLRFTSDLDSVEESGIYRQESPSSGFAYTTTLNLNSSDGRQQLSIERGGNGMKFRGSTHSSDLNWSSWRTVWNDNNLVNPATQSWVESQDYATHSFVEESLNKIASEHIDPDYSISARSNLNTIIITDQYPVQFLKLESDLAPGKQMTIINTAPFDIEVHKDGNIVDIVRSEETNEYYITRQQRLVKKGFYGNAKILS